MMTLSKRTVLPILLFVLSFWMLSACKKTEVAEVIVSADTLLLEVDTIIEIDRRDRYVGQWQFHNIRVHVWLDNSVYPPIQHRDTTLVDFLGAVWFEEAEKIQVNYTDGGTIHFSIGMDGSLYFPAYYPYYGQFQTNGTVFFHTRDGGLGSYVTQDVSGVKVQ